MSRENDRIRRELGMEMIQEQQQYAAMHPRKSVAKIESPVDPRKLADEQCQYVDTGAKYAWIADQLGAPVHLDVYTEPEEKSVDVMAVTRKMCK